MDERAKAAVATVGGGVLMSIAALPLIFILLLGGGGPCGGLGGVAAPSAAAQNAIPANYLALYVAAGHEYGLDWSVLAGIGRIESDHGRSTQPGVSSGVNSYGCCAGPMQFSVIGAGGGTWGAYGVDGNRDGRRSVYDPADAIPAAANYLKASGAPGDYHRALLAYNHAEWYVQEVLAAARRYAATPPPASAVLPAAASGVAAIAVTGDAGGPAGACDDAGGLAIGGGDGRWTLAPNANRTDPATGRVVSLTPAFTAFVDRMATFYSGRLVVTTGTRHSQFVAGTSRESDHWKGSAADFGMVLNGGTNDGPVGDAIAAAAFMAAGVPRDVAIARARAGGAQTVVVNGIRVQVIWRIDGAEIGNHHDHVHVGIGA